MLPPTTLSLTFLDPLTGIIAGAIAGPTLLLLYILRLRRRPVRISSTLLWERAAEDLQANVPFRWLRASLLLLLQLLALAALVLALARPAVLADDAPQGRVVILIDRSASMSAMDMQDNAGRAITRLEAAIDRADKILKDMPLGSRSGGSSSAMLVSYAANAKILAPMTNDRASLRRALETVTPTDQPADLAAALRLARSFTQPTGEEQNGPAGTILIITDHDPGADAGAARVVLAAPPPEQDHDNLAIVALSARRDAETPSTVRVFARIANASREARETPVILRLDGKPVESRVVRLPGVDTAADPPAPGEQGVTFDAPMPDAGLIEVEIARPDALTADNRASAVIRAVGGLRAAVIAPNAMPADAITQTLAALGARETRNLSPAQYESLVGERRLAGVDLLIFDDVEPSALPAIPSISLGAGLPSLTVSVSLGDNPDRASRFATWNRAHPVLRHVAMDAVIFPGIGLVETDEQALQQRAMRVIPLAFGPAGATIMLLDGGVKRIVVGFPLEHSSWWIEPGFAVFLANASEFLTGLGAETPARSWTTGASIVVRAESGASRVRAVGPVTIEAPVLATAEGATASLGVPERAGIYRVEGAVREDSVLGVNLADAEESALRTNAPGEGTTGGVGAQVAAASGDGRAPRELWPWFVLAGAALLTAEWWLYAWRMRA